MATTPQLLGPQLVFDFDWTSSQLIILGHEIQSYNKIPFSPAVPTFEIGVFGQVSQRQLNAATVPYRFDWEFILEDLKKEQLEAAVAIQNTRYSDNNNRANLEVLLSDERFATLELRGSARPVRITENRFDTAPTAYTAWQFSQFVIKFDSFVQRRLNSKFWAVSVSAVESKLTLENTL